MYTYQIDNRLFIINGKDDFIFPANITIFASLEPSTNFRKWQRLLSAFHIKKEKS